MGPHSPFVIGIGVEGDSVTVYRMSSFASGDTTSALLETFPGGRINLASMAERIRFIQVLINLGRYCEAVRSAASDLMLYTKDPYFTVMRCDNAAILKTFREVIKTYLPPRSGDARWLKSIKKFYKDTAGVPYLERCVEYRTDLEWPLGGDEPLSFVLAPVGIPLGEGGLHENVLNAVAFRCIAAALAEIHRRGWAHNDVRWANVVYYPDRGISSFVLIDCEYAWPIGQKYVYLHPNMRRAKLSEKTACSAEFDTNCFLALFPSPSSLIEEAHSQLESRSATLAQVAGMVTVDTPGII